MTASNDSSVQELRRESERSRAALVSTVVELRTKVSDSADELKTRLSPSHIKEEVKDYVREGGEQFFHSIERKARENPLQAVAIGAGLLYPLFGVLKSIPVPIMLVGAGLWLSSQKPGTGNSSVQGIADKISDAGAEGVGRMADSVRGAGAAVATTAESVTDQVRATAHDIRDSVMGMGQTVVGTVKDAATEATERVSGTVSDLGTAVVQAGTRSRNAFEDLVDRNPLLVAGVGLAIGAFVAAALPRTDAENRTFGETSDALKDKALEAASQGVERAKDAAAGMVGDVTAAAARQGLDAQGLAKSVQGVTEGIKSVVDHGLKTALGEADTPPTAPSHDTFQPNKT
jgi:ElaB/YqjD/DUF883 family membrane-anchored ribosome-binding protein